MGTAPIKIRVRLFGGLREEAGSSQLDVEVAHASTVDELRGPKPAPEYPARGLSRVWWLWNMGVDVDEMQRQMHTPKLDWIRKAGRR